MEDQQLIDYLTNIESREGLFLWMVMLVAFLFGFIIAYLLRSGKVRRLKKENAQLRSDLETAEIQATSAQEQLKERNLELQEESREKVDLMDRVARLDRERQQQLTEVVALNRQLEEVQSANRSYEQRIQETEEFDAVTTPDPAPTQQQPIVADTTLAEMSVMQDRLSAFESTLHQLQHENEKLRSDLSELKDHQHTSTEIIPPTGEEPEEPEVVQIETQKTVLYDKIIVPDREQDDLTKIEGLGGFLAKKLNSQGVFSYAEIASWTPDRIEAITEMIGYIPGRIEKDNWVGQAALLLQQQAQEGGAVESYDEPQPEAQEEVAATPKGIKEGDLKIIEGIGPKIEKVLKGAGINDWAALAGTEPGRLKEILEEAGDRFRMHNPYTWPLQARLAAAGRWEEFKNYQDELKGGKES
ncbi:MAG: helix-hairpin-helix domain-containing protein [Bacteroidota bacterium]